MACTILSVSAVSVQDSVAYMNMDLTRERISLIFELSVIFLSFYMVLRFVSAAVVWAILAITSGLDLSSAMVASRYLPLPVCQILLQIVSRALIMACPHACSSSAGVLSAPVQLGAVLGPPL